MYQSSHNSAISELHIGKAYLSHIVRYGPRDNDPNRSAPARRESGGIYRDSTRTRIDHNSWDHSKGLREQNAGAATGNERTSLGR